MNCGRSSSVEWKLPKLQRRVRFPSPAPPPPGRAPGGFVMPVRDARVQRRYGAPAAPEGTPRPQKRMRHCVAGELHDTRVQHGGDTVHNSFAGRQSPTSADMEGASSPPRPGRSASRREKSGPVRPVQQQFREKTRPARTGTPHIRYKIRPARSKCRFFAYFARAGRILSRRLIETAEHGAFSLTLGMTTSQD